MIELSINPNSGYLAMAQEHDMGILKGSITEGRGNLAGIVGEIIVHERYGGIWEPTYDYDILFGKTKVDVKTKRCKSEPQPPYDATVPWTQRNQGCDIYLFTRMLEDYSKIWLLGYMRKADFFETATFSEKGDFDPPRFYYKAACYHVRIDQLKTLADDTN